jgi:hypothetical protein
MQRDMKLTGRVKLEPHGMVFTGAIYDGTPISVDVTKYDVELSEPLTAEKTTVDAFLYVKQEAKQNNRCYLTLPQPSSQCGRQVTVHELSLMPRSASLSDFRPQKLNAKE